MAGLEEVLGEGGLEAILQSFPDAIYAIRANGLFIDANDVFCDMTGYTREELDTMSFSVMVYPDRLEESRERFSQALSGAVQQFASRGVRKSGEIFDVDITNIPMRDLSGAVTAVIGIARDVAEQRRIVQRETAHASIDKLTTRFARVAGWSIDVASETVQWNDDLMALLRFHSTEKATLELALTQFAEGDQTMVSAMFRRCLDDGTPVDVHTRVRDGDGDLLDVRLIGEPVYDDGRVTRIVGVLHDVTSFLHQRAAIEQQNDHLWETINGVRAGLVFINRDWFVEYVNDAALKILGINRETLLATSAKTLIDRRLDPDHQALYERAMDLGEYGSKTVYIPRLKRWYEIAAYPARDGIVVSGRDASVERETRQRELVSNEQANLLRQMVELSHEAMIMQDAEKRVNYWNKSAEDLYGWTFEEVAGRDLNELLYLDLAEARHATEVLLRDGMWIGDVEQRTKSGTSVVVHARWQLVRDGEGTPVGAFGVNRDVTVERREREQHARNQRIESIGTLASGIAHDLNNILTPVLLTLEVLEREQATPELRELVHTIESRVKRGADMIRQVLSFARGVGGERDVVETRGLLDDVCQLTRETLPKNIEVRLHVDEQLWPVLGDATQLMQVLLNLVTNARDAMPDGGVLEVSGRNGYGSDAGRIATDLDGARFVYLEVTDSGVGMSELEMGRIFEPFYSTKQIGTGTGLGLSTSEAIAKSHGGRLEVSSVRHKGSRFTFVIPATELALVTSDIVATFEVPGEQPVGSNRQFRVLVVDDEPAIASMFETILRLDGYDVDVAYDGAEALDVVDRALEPYDVIVTDLNMPRVSGDVFAQAVVARGVPSRFVFMSGLNVPEPLRSEEVFRHSVFLEKPFPSSVLLEALRTMLQGDEQLS